MSSRKAELLRVEFGIHTYGDLLMDIPFRYVDKSSVSLIRDIRLTGDPVQLEGKFVSFRTEGAGPKKRLIGEFEDDTGSIDIIWFARIKEIEKWIRLHEPYRLYGKPQEFKRSINIVHPELDNLKTGREKSIGLEPVYRSTEKLMLAGLDSKGRRKLVEQIFHELRATDIPENLPEEWIQRLRFQSRFKTWRDIHFPSSMEDMWNARNRLKFEELFFLQMLLLRTKAKRKVDIPGFTFTEIGSLFNTFFHSHLTFELTEAQKRVIREIRHDTGSGRQMNRLLQGDVGSGKTIVALMCMLIAADNGYQSTLMAPTEVLAMQHYQSLSQSLGDLPVRLGFLSGSITGQARQQVLQGIISGDIHILIGTHALIEEGVKFHKLGLAVIDEQHRFGVEQRARMWQKTESAPPHILVMTATPIPRTLALTVYGDLDVSILDELPPGRKPVKTTQRTEAHRTKVMEFVRSEIDKGRQVYFIFPLIEESEKLDLENLQDGYERILGLFPRPKYQISVVHGRMKAEEKDEEMQRFKEGRTQIMVSTTVIEVGVNVPNASVMIIENAERFGLSQLHQLRGRVGRGADQSYCILMTSYQQSKTAKERLQVICNSNDGFVIAEADLRLRGPGDISGTRQSGAYDFKIANLVEDQAILSTARTFAEKLLEQDPHFRSPAFFPVYQYLSREFKYKTDWSRIS